MLSRFLVGQKNTQKTHLAFGYSRKLRRTDEVLGEMNKRSRGVERSGVAGGLTEAMSARPLWSRERWIVPDSQ